MGNESSANTHHTTHQLTKSNTKQEIKTDIDEKQSYWQQSHNTLKLFRDQWLCAIRLRPIMITNKLHGMNDHSNNIEFNEALSRFDDLIIYQSGIQITLNSNSYLIFPDYSSIVKDSFIKNWHSKIHEINMEIKAVFQFDLKYINERIFYGNNYGYIDTVKFSDDDNIFLSVSNKTLYDQQLFNDKQFLRKSNLPIEILKVICYEYVGKVNNNLEHFYISHPFVSIDNDGNAKDYDWVCYKIKNGKTEEIIFHTGINLLGKYFNLETKLFVETLPPDVSRMVGVNGNCIIDTLIGRSNHLSRTFSY